MESKQKKIALILFGLSRSLTKTKESIFKHIVNPCMEAGYIVDIFIHTNTIQGEYKNCWSKEDIKEYKNENIEELLHPKIALSDDQDSIESALKIEEYYTKLGNWTGMNEPTTKYLIRNMCLALYSKKKICQVVEQYQDEYEYAILTRPDMYFKNSFPVEALYSLTETTIILPSCDSYSGCNDRLCAGKLKPILQIGTLFDELKEYSKKKSIISERFLLDKLTEYKIKIEKYTINYEMIRAK